MTFQPSFKSTCQIPPASDGLEAGAAAPKRPARAYYIDRLRVALTALLALLPDGGARQLFLALAVSLASHRVYAHYAPFVDDDDARLAEVANAELVLVFFACLALFVDGAGGASRLRLGSFATAVALNYVSQSA